MMSLSVEAMFFLSSPVGHRVLHPFPTRRSSDLRYCPPPGDYLNWAFAGGSPQLLTDTIHGRGRDDEELPRAAGKDRKSTRTNSSYTNSTYDVFPSKKKPGIFNRERKRQNRRAFA